MPDAVHLRGTVAVLLGLVLIAGCRESPVAPTVRSPAAVGTAGFPELGRPARVYLGVDVPMVAPGGDSLMSRYVLYDAGSFALQLVSARRSFFVEYRGTYDEQDGHITFAWEGWSLAGPWAAEGSITAESLTVRYNVVMILLDFIDGVYQRVP